VAHQQSRLRIYFQNCPAIGARNLKRLVFVLSHGQSALYAHQPGFSSAKVPAALSRTNA
jgi:hypothetical protein